MQPQTHADFTTDCNTEEISFYCKNDDILTFLITQYGVGDNIEKNEMGWARGAYG